MTVIDTKKAPVMVLVLTALLFSYTNSNAASPSKDIYKPDNFTVVPHDTWMPTTEYRTHDNGNYHRYHSSSPKQHSQIESNRADEKKEPKRLYRYAFESDYRFKRFHHFPHNRFGRDYHYNRSDRRFINTLVGGAVLYRLFK